MSAQRVPTVHDKDNKDIVAAQHIENHNVVTDPESGNVRKPKHTANKQMDDAARILEESGPVEYTPEDRKRVLRRIDLFVCVPMCIVYFLQQMDKSTVGYGSVFDLITATGLVGQEYSWLTSVVYIAQLVCQPLSAYALIVFPVKYWVMFCFISWSIVTLCTAAATNFTGLVIARLVLGAFEATILPSFVLITQMWWTRREQSYRTIAYQIANSFAAIVGPLLSYGIGHISKGIYAYQGIFLCIGGISFFCCPIVWYLLPNSPTTAKFLRHGNDRLIALDRVKENNTGTKSSQWKWGQVKETFLDPKTYLWSLMYLCTAMPSGGFGAFGGLITEGFGFSGFTSILMQIPTGVIGIIALLIAIFITNKIKLRAPVLFFVCLFPIAGGAALIHVSRSNTGGLIGAYYVAYVLAALQPLLYSWANLNAAGSTKRVVTTATMFVFQCAGNIIGPQAYTTNQAPYYLTGLTVSLSFWAALCGLIVITGFYLTYLNKKQEKRRIALGLPGKLKDVSIMAPHEAEAYRIELAESLRAQGFDENRLYEGAFDDMTDFENPLFIYVV